MIIEISKMFNEEEKLFYAVKRVVYALNKRKMSIGNERARLRLLNTPSQKVSLVDLPCIVCLNVFSRLDTKDILSLYNSCNPFRRLTQHPNLIEIGTFILRKKPIGGE
jgi:hypothetical protein